MKCDAAHPECGPCKRLNLPCGGYKTRPTSLKFKDQTPKFFATKSPGQAALLLAPTCSPSSELDQAPPVLNLTNTHPLRDPNNAVPFFLGHYATMGRDLGSARGFHEMLVPVFLVFVFLRPCV